MKLGRYTCKVGNKLVSSNMPATFNLPKPSNADIMRLEQALMALPGADTSGGDVENYFSEGLHARLLRIPAGGVVVGHIHLKGQINFLTKGTIRVTTDEGVQELTAPQIVVSGPGTKRAGFALTDVEWVTVLATNLTDIDEMKRELLATGFDDPRLVEKLEVLCPGSQ